MKKVIAGVILSMVGMGFSVPSIAASGDTGSQAKGASGEAGSASTSGTAAKPVVKEANGSSKTADGSAALKEAHKKSSQEYKAAKEKCGEMKGNEKEVCVAEARAARTKANAEAEASVMNTSSARRKAQVDIAKAEYGVAKAKCKAKKGDEKDKCIKDAKEARAKATLETTTQEKAGTLTHPAKREPNQDRAGTRPETSSEKK